MVVNAGMVELLSNFACAARSRGISTANVVVFATDAAALTAAESLGLGAFLDTEGGFGILPTDEAKQYGDAAFTAMMYAKVLAVYLPMMLGYDVLFQVREGEEREREREEERKRGRGEAGSGERRSERVLESERERTLRRADSLAKRLTASISSKSPPPSTHLRFFRASRDNSLPLSSFYSPPLSMLEIFLGGGRERQEERESRPPLAKRLPVPGSRRAHTDGSPEVLLSNEQQNASPPFRLPQPLPPPALVARYCFLFRPSSEKKLEILSATAFVPANFV